MDNFNQFTLVDIFKKFYIVRDEVFLIHRLSNRMKKCERGEKYKEELLVKVLSPSRHPKGINGPVDAASVFRTMEPDLGEKSQFYTSLPTWKLHSVISHLMGSTTLLPHCLPQPFSAHN